MDMRPAASPKSTPVLSKHSEDQQHLIDQWGWLDSGCNGLGSG